MREKFFISCNKQGKEISVETQLKIANLRYENEELTKKNEKPNKYTETEVTAVTELFFTTSWYSHVLITKLRKQILDKDSICNCKFSLKDTVSRSISSKNNKYLESKY